MDTSNARIANSPDGRKHLYYPISDSISISYFMSLLHT